MGAQVEKKIYTVLEPYLKEEMAKGEKIPFSDTLRMTKDGLEEKERELDWSEFDGYQVGNGQITIFAQPDKSAWLSIPLPEVDNLPILVRWLKQHEFTAPSMITVEAKR